MDLNKLFLIRSGNMIGVVGLKIFLVMRIATSDMGRGCLAVGRSRRMSLNCGAF